MQAEASIGIDLGGTKIAGALLIAGEVEPLQRLRVATPREDYQGTLAAIAALVADLDEHWKSHCQDDDDSGVAPVPVGMGTPGVWLPGEGVMGSCNSTWLNGRPLLDDLQKKLTRPLALANDADCFALAQSRLQPVLGIGLTFGIILGTGVGGGWVFNGTPRQGPNRLSGEWGHTPLPYFGDSADGTLRALERELPERSCYCGRLNCIETFLCGPALLRTAHTLWPELAGVASLETLLANDAPETRLLLQLYSDMLARSLAQVVNGNDPDHIVLGGGLSNLSLLYDALPRRIPAYLFSRQRCATPILAPAGGDDAGVIGAAMLCEPQGRRDDGHQPFSTLQEP